MHCFLANRNGKDRLIVGLCRVFTHEDDELAVNASSRLGRNDRKIAFFALLCSGDRRFGLLFSALARYLLILELSRDFGRPTEADFLEFSSSAFTTHERFPAGKLTFTYLGALGVPNGVR